MVKQTVLTISPKLKTTKQMKMERLTGKKSPQHVFNSVLWDMLMRNGGKMSISGERLRQVPSKVVVRGEWDEPSQSMILTAVVNKGDIISSQGLYVGRDDGQ